MSRVFMAVNVYYIVSSFVMRTHVQICSRASGCMYVVVVVASERLSVCMMECALHPNYSHSICFRYPICGLSGH